ncbi:MAG TPA: hypothetical protein VFV01_47845 [Spirillospora sp.]|nr:hypothetical protein [Spirillospora sp.]
MTAPRLTLIPGGAGLDGSAPSGPPAPPVSTGDSAELEARVTLRRLADRIVAIQTADVPLAGDDPDQLVAVFHKDALPELAGLLYENRSQP